MNSFEGDVWGRRPEGRRRSSDFEHTLGGEVKCSGVGVHSGQPVDMILRPAGVGTGVVFVRKDLPDEPRFLARAARVVDTTLATTLGAGSARLSTVEHLISALRGMGVDNAIVEVFGAEVPIMDGSAAPFVYLIEQVGVVRQSRTRRRIVIRKPVEVREGNRHVCVIPSRDFKISVEVEFAHPAIGRQALHALRVTPRSYAREIAPARTFGFLADAQRLQAQGRGLGCSLASTIVLDERRVLNPEGLRFRDEFARHKALDLIGDLALLGLPLQGHFKAVRSGHALHQALVAELRANPSCWTIETGDPATQPADDAGDALSVPSLNPAS